jgi:hypothetical protein
MSVSIMGVKCCRVGELIGAGVKMGDGMTPGGGKWLVFREFE